MLKNSFMLFAVILVIIAGAIFLGCSSPNPTPGTPVIVEPTWDTYDGWVRFTTNDENYYNYYFWRGYDSTDSLYPITVQMKKVTGAPGYGYGIVFSHQNDGRMYILELSTQYGYYRIRQKDSAGNYSSITNDGNGNSWILSDAITAGLSSINTVNVSYNQDNTTYYISINGESVYSFNRNSQTVNLEGGKAGFYVVVGKKDYEDFPNTMEDVRFKMTSPVTIP